MEIELGRHCRSHTDFAGYVRDSLGAAGLTPVVEDELATLFGLADRLDILERDTECDGRTYAVCARTYDEMRRKVSARIEHVSSGSPIADALASAMGQIKSC